MIQHDQVFNIKNQRIGQRWSPLCDDVPPSPGLAYYTSAGKLGGKHPAPGLP